MVLFKIECMVETYRYFENFLQPCFFSECSTVRVQLPTTDSMINMVLTNTVDQKKVNIAMMNNVANVQYHRVHYYI